MTEMYELLERVLTEIENGADPEAALRAHPEQAAELRPLVQAALEARARAVTGPSAEVLRRNRARLLQRAAQLREEQERPAPFFWFPRLRRTAVSLAVLTVFLFSSARLVSASSAALPGDSLYTTKRWWENVTITFTFDPQARQALEVEYETERLHEVNDLFATGRAEDVEFAGVVRLVNGSSLTVGTVPVLVTSQTDLPGTPLQPGMAVRVEGVTVSGNGVVTATQIELLPPGAPLPEVEDGGSPESQETEGTSTPQPTSTPTPAQTRSVTVTPTRTGTPTLTPTVTPSLPPANANGNQNANNNQNTNTNPGGGSNTNTDTNTNTNTNANDDANDNSNSNGNDDHGGNSNNGNGN